MDYTTLGRTGLSVSRVGLGCGGYSRLGISSGSTNDQAVAIVKRALELGITLIDTSEWYETETYIGTAIQGFDRSKLVLCTKTGAGSPDAPRDPADIHKSVEKSLANFGTDVIDIYQMHGISAALYPHVKENIVPELIKLQEQGKIRFLGITEAFESDTRHEMLQLASRDSVWDTLMVGHNIINTSARKTVFPSSRKHSMGILNMFAVRHALINRENLQPVLAKLIESGQVNASAIDLNNPLEFLVNETDNLAEAAYRYCRHDPDVNVVLCGTGSIAHLEENIRSMHKGPLSEKSRALLDEIFSAVDGESGKKYASSW